jgi:hypothetical protein
VRRVAKSITTPQLCAETLPDAELLWQYFFAALRHKDLTMPSRFAALRLIGTALALCVVMLAMPAAAQPDFGDDKGQWANDGECDDPRFEGDGSATTLLDEDRGHDASDCRNLFNAGRIRLRTAADDDSAADGGAVDFGDDESRWARDGECDDPRFEGEGSADTLVDADLYHDATDCRTLLRQGRVSLRSGADQTSAEDGVHRGRLERGDDTLTSGEFADTYTFAGVRGQRAVVDLRSGDFDPYVLVRAPSGEQFDNDDFEGDASRSLLSLDLTESGEYKVTVTSYSEGEAGGYTLAIDVGNSTPAARIEHSGSLQSGDETLTSGEYVDSYEFEGWPGQHVALDLRSAAFDTYLIVKDPNGEQTENDDADDGGTGHSHLEMDLAERGTYRVLVTSYEKGESGSYRLVIDPAAGGQTAPVNRDVTTLTVGQPANGELEDGDQALDTGEYRDVYVFDGTAGQSVRIELASSDFDTYLGLVTPSDEPIENDDYEGDAARSVVELTLPETGRYRVMATSYAAAETGSYRLALSRSSTAPAVEERAGGRVYGIFAGISDYRGDDNDLAYTAEDATRIRDALLRRGGMRQQDAFTLTDRDATIANLRNAIREISRRIKPEDTFVMFYSGHGGRLPREGGPESTDPDGLDETLTLYDGDLRDDELRELFDDIHASTTLLWLDSCFSGGFAKDIVSAPGRMGIFSSEEDVTSQVADKFRAGGYLSVFLDEAIAQGRADEDKNESITAIELSQYLHERYRSDVKGPANDDFVMTGGRQMGYQHLVIDRGSIGPYDVLFQR